MIIAEVWRGWGRREGTSLYLLSVENNNTNNKGGDNYHLQITCHGTITNTHFLILFVFKKEETKAK